MGSSPREHVARAILKPRDARALWTYWSVGLTRSCRQQLRWHGTHSIVNEGGMCWALLLPNCLGPLEPIETGLNATAQ